MISIWNHYKIVQDKPIYSQSARLSERRNLFQVKRSISGRKKLRGAGQVQVRGAHLRRKRFLPESTCFVDPEILWSYSALMWKQTGYKHWRGEDESFLHKGVLSEEASRDEGALWKSYPQTVGSRLMVPRVDSPENHYEDSWMSTPPLMKNAKVRL